jgi:hypothetical protein
MFSQNNDSCGTGQGKIAPGGTPFLSRRFRLDRADVAWLRFLVEGYDGLLFLRTLDGREALVELAWSPCCEEEAEEVLAALAAGCGLREAPAPDR